MTNNPATGSRSLISQLFAAALDGDHDAGEALAALAEDRSAPRDGAREAASAARELERVGACPISDELAPGAFGRVWAVGYVDQLVARFRDETRRTGTTRS